MNRSRLLLAGYIPFVLAIAIMAIMPVYHWFIPPFMILWAIYFIFRIGSWHEAFTELDFQRKTLYILFILFFIWQLVGMLYSENHKGGWRNIELHISLIIFPLVLLLPGPFIMKRCGLLLKLFAISTFSFLVFCYWFAFSRSCSFQDGHLIFNPYLHDYTWLNYFYALEFAIFQHTSYLSMFTLLSIFISFDASFNKSLPIKYRIFWIAAGFVMIVSVYFLSSRAGILTLIVTVPVYSILKLRNHKYRSYLILLVGFVTIILMIVAFTNPRVNNYLKWKDEKKVADVEVQNDRLIIYSSAVELIKSNYLMGVGTGDIQGELNKIYFRKGYPHLAEVNTNSHNQYFETIIENGLAAIVILVLMFSVMFYIAFKEKNMLYLMFLLIVIISFLFETMLNRLAGVTFFSLFSFLLLLNESEKKSNVSNL
jgi:O-antigen ligase